KFASKYKLDLLTVDGAGGGTGMSPWRMMNEWGVPPVEIHSLLYQYASRLAEQGEHVPALAAAGGPADTVQISADARAWWHPGRSGVLRLGPNVLAEFGEIHPKVLKALDIDGRVLAFEVFLEAVPAPKKKALKARPAVSIPELNPVRRDFAFLAPAGLPAADLLKAVKGADKQLVADAILFDVYTGKGVPEGQVSLAVEVTLQPADKTLTDKEIEAAAAKIVKAGEKAGASLRGERWSA
ncbi:MAG: hypothetical protein ACOC20_00500, partial [Oceanicaulis sp.]